MPQYPTESDLIRERGIRLGKFNLWKPTVQEFQVMVVEQWKRLLLDTKDWDILKLNERIIVAVEMNCREKFYKGQDYIYGDYKGKAGDDRGMITIYINDVLTANYWQKDLCAAHIYFILEHELKHWFGISHEEMPNISDFKYPYSQPEKEKSK